MSINFASPSMRAAGSDLAVSISPLGLVELSDEEFEVSGPRLNRYALAWANYLGHYYGYRREAGEPQISFNYVRAFADWINNFAFSRGFQVKTAKQYEAIIPGLLKKVWEVDNDKASILWDMGQMGGVSGDSFVKVAWEPAFEDSVGYFHPGKVKLINLNSAYCYPEWHPHDQDRLLRFKLKYRFWGTSAEGTRQVFTYTEILTDEWIEEYVNDELIDQRPNPLGVIPVVHVPNIKVSGSPWGLSDIQDITMLNREYNEKALEISDIINYYSAPVTVIVGAKGNNLEKGAKKVWYLPKDATAQNLSGGTEAIPAALEYLETIKRAMHEITGVPESALGQMQPISNTSGVALSIMYQPAMQRYHMKLVQYTKGLTKINEYILKTLFTFDPASTQYDPTTQGILEEGQPSFVDPRDPLAYQTEIHWPAPLPSDVLIKLNEITLKMQLGLESKRGALADLGNEFPDEKMQEIFTELVEDAKEQGALDMLRAQISAAVMEITGMIPGEGAPTPAPTGDETNNSAGSSGDNSSSAENASAVSPLGALGAMEMNNILNEIVTQAYSPRTPMRRNPDADN